ncbi:MAG: hypothetical protein ACT4PT_08990 [Methanobacteriota archaeon]
MRVTVSGVQTVIVLVAMSGGFVVLSHQEEWTDLVANLNDNVMRDLSRGSLRVVSAMGLSGDDGVKEVLLTLQTGGASGSVTVDGTMVRIASDSQMTYTELGAVSPASTLRVLRDRDGSFARGYLDDGDLIELSLRLDLLGQPFGAGDSLHLTFLPMEAAPVEVHVEAPAALAPHRFVELSVRQMF